METSVGRPRYRPSSTDFLTKEGVSVHRTVEDVSDTSSYIEGLVARLDSEPGCIFESAYEYPGRYARWTMGFASPPIKFEAWNVNRRIKVTALNKRGDLLLPLFKNILSSCTAVESDILFQDHFLEAKVKLSDGTFTEEERSKQNSIFSVIRDVIACFKVETEIDPQLGLYGAFGYDLTFQFESIKLKHVREVDQRDLVLYLPDDIFVFDKQSKAGWRLIYDFSFTLITVHEEEKYSTIGVVGEKVYDEFVPYSFSDEKDLLKECDHARGEYANSVNLAKREFKAGNLFEVVLSQTFSDPCYQKPSRLFYTLLRTNPSPYMFLINLGDKEYLVGASPEMFVRAEKITSVDEITGKETEEIMIETCPISGTIKRGKNALEDAERIKEILSNAKEESELTMCTDVDRNDKSRVCKHGSVQVMGRRQIEKYSKVIHTVDHVVGILREGFDALDAFLVHTWAVTVTGAPKTWAIQFVEDQEKSPRRWYGGAVGLLGFDGSMNTGMTLRTVRIKDGIGQVRVGATLLYDSIPESEESETELKASALREAIKLTNDKGSLNSRSNGIQKTHSYSKLDVPKYDYVALVIDHQDSFVNTLSNYFRQLNIDVVTVRYSSVSEEMIQRVRPNLAVMSPGPGTPKDFNTSRTIDLLIKLKVPIFGVCLGLQALVEHFGGKLDVLSYPMHGKPSTIQTFPSKSTSSVFSGLPEAFVVGRYHSLHANIAAFPHKEFEVIASTEEKEDGAQIIMAIQHKKLPIAAVQFHPESIMTSPVIGLKILQNCVELLKFE